MVHKQRVGNMFVLGFESGKVTRTDEYGNVEEMVEGSGGHKWMNKKTGKIRES